MSRTIKVDIWPDIACPWCDLGKHRFFGAHEPGTFLLALDRAGAEATGQ